MADQGSDWQDKTAKKPVLKTLDDLLSAAGVLEQRVAPSVQHKAYDAVREMALDIIAKEALGIGLERTVNRYDDERDTQLRGEQALVELYAEKGFGDITQAPAKVEKIKGALKEALGKFEIAPSRGAAPTRPHGRGMVSFGSGHG